MWMLGLAMAARAADPAFSTAAGEVVEKAETHLTGELGGTYATGNTNLYAINGLVAFSHKVSKDKVSAVAGLNLGAAIVDADGNGVVDESDRDNGFERNAQRLYADVRYDRFVTDNTSLYVLAGAFSDRFAGYDLRAHEQIGVARTLLKKMMEDGKTVKAEVRTELGVDWAQEDYIADANLPSSAKFVAARVLAAGSYRFNDSVAIADTAEVYENFVDPADLRVLNTATLTSALAKNLSLKLSHSLIFDNVPVEGFQPLDQTAMMTLVVTLL